MAIRYNTRVQLKFDTWDNWANETGQAFVPMAGEICICKIPKEETNTGEVIAEDAYLVKVGDGETTFETLPWLSAQAADVYAWAKMSEEEFRAWLVSAAGPSLATNTQVASIVTDIDNMELNEPQANGTATHVITDISQVRGKVSATKKNLPTVNDPSASGESITFIDTIKQANGAIVPTKKTVRPASTTQTGVVKLGAEGGAATWSRTEEANTAAANAQNSADDAQKAADDAQDAADAANNAIAAMNASPSNAEGNAITFIDNIVQTKGKLTTISRKTVPSASTGTEGLAKLGAEGGAATYERAEQLALQIIDIQSKISNAMHFLGVCTTALSDGSTTSSIVIKDGDTNITVNMTAADAGSVVLAPYVAESAPNNQGDSYEFVWTGSKWELLGQEGSFAIKGSIVNSDINAAAAIDPTKIATSLTGGTNLKTDVSGIENRVTSAETNIANLQTATETTLPNLINTTVDTLGKSLVSQGGVRQTITGISYNEGTDKITVTYEDIPPATTGQTGIVQLYNNVDNDSSTLAATANAVKIAYDQAVTATSNAATNATILKTAWKTSTITNVTTSNTPGSLAGNPRAVGTATGISPLTINDTEITYIIFDCGSATTNV